jgi:hypothetical protein
MADYKKVAIDIMENGFTVTVKGRGHKGKQFVFPDAKSMNEWLKDNLAATGEVEEFSEALDEKPAQEQLDNSLFVGYNTLDTKFTAKSNV